MSIPHSLKLVGSISGTWALMTILGAVLAYIPDHLDFSIFTTYLSDMGAAPICSQIAKTDDGGFLLAGLIQIINGRSYDAIILRTDAEGQTEGR